MELPAESEVFADSAYTNYEIEDQLFECDQIALKVNRKSNATRKDSVSAAFIKEYMRKRVETTISEIKGVIPKKDTRRDLQRLAPENHLVHLRFYAK